LFETHPAAEEKKENSPGWIRERSQKSDEKVPGGRKERDEPDVESVFTEKLARGKKKDLLFGGEKDRMRGLATQQGSQGTKNGGREKKRGKGRGWVSSI